MILISQNLAKHFFGLAPWRLAPGGPNWLRDLHGVREPKGSRRLLGVTSSGAVLVFGMLCFGKD